MDRKIWKTVSPTAWRHPTHNPSSYTRLRGYRRVYIGTSGRTWNCSPLWLDNERLCTSAREWDYLKSDFTGTIESSAVTKATTEVAPHCCLPVKAVIAKQDVSVFSSAKGATRTIGTAADSWINKKRLSDTAEVSSLTWFWEEVAQGHFKRGQHTRTELELEYKAITQ